MFWKDVCIKVRGSLMVFSLQVAIIQARNGIPVSYT